MVAYLTFEKEDLAVEVERYKEDLRGWFTFIISVWIITNYFILNLQLYIILSFNLSQLFTFFFKFESSVNASEDHLCKLGKA